jgi:hypothetical protein
MLKKIWLKWRNLGEILSMGLCPYWVPLLVIVAVLAIIL